MRVLSLLEAINSLDYEISDNEERISHNRSQLTNILDIYQTPFLGEKLERYFEGWKSEITSTGTLSYRQNESINWVRDSNYYIISNKNSAFVEKQADCGDYQPVLYHIQPVTFADFVNDCLRSELVLFWNQQSVDKINKGANPFFG